MAIHPNRISTASWAKPTDPILYGIHLSEYHFIQSHRDRLLSTVQIELAAYLNSNNILDSGDFPDVTRLTGEYYIADESYTSHVGPVWIQIGIMCHFLEKTWHPGQVDSDYLGLEVWLRFDPHSAAFSVFRNTDSSSI